MGILELVILGFAVNVLCAYVLYQAAQRTGRRPWVWAIVGLLTSIIGLIVWRVAEGPILAPGSRSYE